MQGGSAHALIFSWACWSGIWPRMDVRRLAGPNVLARAGTLRQTLFAYFDSSWKTGSCTARIYAGNFGPRLFR